jgi:hypothetical protein
MLPPSQARTLAEIRAELARLIRYDDESVVAAIWIRQRYDGGWHSTYAEARRAAVRTAWHEAGHAVAALAIGARFSSASIHHGTRSAGRVHRLTIETESSFVIDAAGQIAERLMNWTMLERDEELAAWLPTWRGDGGDARRFRSAIISRFAGNEVAAWRYSEQVLVPLRPKVRGLARALLAHPRPLPYGVAAELVGLVREG